MDGTDAGDEEVVIPMTSGGALFYDYSGSGLTTWFIGNWKINFMVKGDCYGRGYDSTLAAVLDSTSDNPGLWLWDLSTGWVHLSSYIPDDIY
jgi:hypothetical protein